MLGKHPNHVSSLATGSTGSTASECTPATRVSEAWTLDLDCKASRKPVFIPIAVPTSPIMIMFYRPKPESWQGDVFHR